jgi:uncharacterized protein YrrD
MDLPLNADVFCTDGLCGQSTEIVLDKSDQVTHLVVKEQPWPHTDLLVPVNLVTETTSHAIQLRCSKEELAKLQTFHEIKAIQEEVPRYVAGPYMMPIEFPTTKWVVVRSEAIPPGEVAVCQGAHVEATDGRVGRLDEFLVDPVSDQVTHLVLREGHLWGKRDVTIPVSEIDHLEENTIYLKLNRDQVEALPSVPTGLR